MPIYCPCSQILLLAYKDTQIWPISFFYQWLLYPDHWYMFTIVTYRGQEIFQAPIMGYINLVTYVQQEIDNILCDI